MYTFLKLWPLSNFQTHFKRSVPAISTEMALKRIERKRDSYIFSFFVVGDLFSARLANLFFSFPLEMKQSLSQIVCRNPLSLSYFFFLNVYIWNVYFLLKHETYKTMYLCIYIDICI